MLELIFFAFNFTFKPMNGQVGVYPGDHLVGLKGFCNIIDGAQMKPFYLVFGVNRGDTEA